VSSISREPNLAELRALVSFEEHIEECRTCRDALRYDYATPCRRGKKLEKEIYFYFSGRDDGMIYSTQPGEASRVRIEVPSWYRAVFQLLGVPGSRWRRLESKTTRECLNYPTEYPLLSSRNHESLFGVSESRLRRGGYRIVQLRKETVRYFIWE
jgi:hypothetical protein